MTIDGYTQPGASPNTLPVGSNAVLVIEIDGNGLDSFLRISQPSTIRGLVINDFAAGISLELGPGGSVVAGCFIGTDPTGTVAVGNGPGVMVVGSSNNLIGGFGAADRNVISGNSGYGVWVFEETGGGILGAPSTGSSTEGNQVVGNLIGVNATGTAALPNGSAGILVSGARNTAILQNVVAGHAIDIRAASGGGLFPLPTAGTRIEGNLVGTNASGTAALGRMGPDVGIEFQNVNGTLLQPLAATVRNNVIASQDIGIRVFQSRDIVLQGNSIGCNLGCTALIPHPETPGAGVWIDASSAVQVGGVSPGEGNAIVGWGTGVQVSGATFGGRVRGNFIHSNEGLGIDLDPPGVTANDTGDADSGPNGLQNFPIVRRSTPLPGGTNVEGFLRSAPDTTYTLDFYANDSCPPNPQEFLEGRTWLGAFDFTTDATGGVAFNLDVPATTLPGQEVSATATAPDGSTSEFSQRVLLSIDPRSGPPEGGTPVTLTGMFFEPGATLEVFLFPVAATFVNETTLNAVMPPLFAGGAYDVSVINPSGVSGTLRRGWFVDFSDVPGGHPFHDFVNRLVLNGIAAGVPGGAFWVDAPVSRAQMAVFLLRGREGVCYTPPPETGTVFGDVSAVSFAAAWIEEISRRGITAGCGGGNFCPNDEVTREQMAVFLLRTVEDPTYMPPPCTTPTFLDVPCSSSFAIWIEELSRRGVTAGCGSGNYCPADFISRGQMAVFLSVALNLP